MPRRSDITIPKKCLQAIPEFTKEQQEMVLRTMLRLINHKIARINHVYIVVRNFGTISTRANRTIGRKNYQGKYIRAYWKERKKEIELTEKKLLF